MDASKARLQCTICGSRFGAKKCYFCESRICTSCAVGPELSGSSTTKCLNCERKKINKVSLPLLLKRNAYIIGIIGGFWIFTIFPIPFLHLAGIDVHPSAFQPVLIASALMAIPFVFMFVAWQRRAPRGTS